MVRERSVRHQANPQCRASNRESAAWVLAMPHRRVRRACLRREHNGRIDLLWQIVACKVENGQSLFFHETFFVVDHAVAGVFGDFEIAGVHADGVFGADFHTKAAVNAFA